MTVEAGISGRALFGGVAFVALAMLSGCGDLSECVVADNSAGGVVIVSDLKVLHNYSLSIGAAWKSMPLTRDSVMFAEHNWIADPPPGIFLQTGTKVTVLDRRFLEAGELLEPYSANSYDMQRNLAVEVIHVVVRQGPHQNSQGWLPHYSCRPTVVLP